MLQAESGPDFRELLQRVWSRKKTLVAFVAAALLATALIIRQITPLYSANALVLVGSPPAQIVDLRAVLSGISADTEAVDSEMEVLRSPALANQVIDELSLDENPEFNPTLQPKSALSESVRKVRKFVQGIVESILGSSEPPPEYGPPTREDFLAAQRADVLDTFLSRLQVTARDQTRLLEISFTSEDPALAADVVNSLVSHYISDQVDRKYQATLRAAQWLSDNVNSWQDRTLEAERRLEEFRTKAGLLEGDNGILLSGQLSEANAQLATARLNRIAAEARLRHMKQYGQGDAIAGTDEFLRSPMLQHLRQQEADLMSQEIQLRAQYGAKHERVANVDAELTDLRRRIVTEIGRVIDGLEIEVESARSVEQSLEADLQSLKENVSKANMSKVELQALQREADANRTILQVFMSRLAETRGQADKDILQPDARVISEASIPLGPSFPQGKMYLALALLLSGLAGLAFVFVTDWLRRGFHSGEEIERSTGLPVLGLFPRLSGRNHRHRQLAPAILDHQPSALDDSVRWLGTSLSLLTPTPKSILITSAEQKEGKTTTAICLAQMLALAKHKVVVIDADFSQPRLHDAFTTPERSGLLEFLAGVAPLDQAIHEDKASGVHVIPAGALEVHSPGIMAAGDMESLLAALGDKFDFVIVDGPPVLEEPETRLLANVSDATILVVRWAATERRAVKLALAGIEQAGGRIVGILLSMVDIRKYARDSYGDSHRYLRHRRRWRLDQTVRGWLGYWEHRLRGRSIGRRDPERRYAKRTRQAAAPRRPR